MGSGRERSNATNLDLARALGATATLPPILDCPRVGSSRARVLDRDQVNVELTLRVSDAAVVAEHDGTAVARVSDDEINATLVHCIAHRGYSYTSKLANVDDDAEATLDFWQS